MSETEEVAMGIPRRMRLGETMQEAQAVADSIA
jgi:hypothetical protein